MYSYIIHKNTHIHNIRERKKFVTTMLRNNCSDLPAHSISFAIWYKYMQQIIPRYRHYFMGGHELAYNLLYVVSDRIYVHTKNVRVLV